MPLNLLDLIRPHYAALQGYVSAGMEVQKDEVKVFMNANENPYPLPGLEGLNRYPQPQPPELLEAYAKLYGVSSKNIVATRGADEAIAILTRLFCEPHKDSVLIPQPTFGMYAVNARSMPVNIIETSLDERKGRFEIEFGLINDIFDEESPPKLVYLCSPNNPTGNVLDYDTMRSVCRIAESKAAVIVDETYIEFADQKSMTHALREHPNLIILRTLSKSYSMAGMRMGCMISADEEFIKLVRTKCLDAYPLPIASIDAALKVMQPEMQKLAAENRKKLVVERNRIAEAFKQSNLVWDVFDSDANFVLIRMKKAKEFVAFCAQHNFILRDFSSKPDTMDCIRISAGTPEQTDRLIELLKVFQR